MIKIIAAIIGCYALSYSHYFIDGDLAWYVLANNCRLIIAIHSIILYIVAKLGKSKLKDFFLIMSIHWSSAFFFSLLDDLGLTDGEISGFILTQLFIFLEILLFTFLTSSIIYKTIIQRENNDKKRN